MSSSEAIAGSSEQASSQKPSRVTARRLLERMTGPSSSHSMGPQKLGHLVHTFVSVLDGRVCHVEVSLFNSLAGCGGKLDAHGTRHAIAAGLQGRAPGEPIRDALDSLGFPIVFKEKAEPRLHPNLIRMEVQTDIGSTCRRVVTCEARSIGGGMLEVDAFVLRPTEEEGST